MNQRCLDSKVIGLVSLMSEKVLRGSLAKPCKKPCKTWDQHEDEVDDDDDDDDDDDAKDG